VRRAQWFGVMLVAAMSASGVSCVSHPLPPQDAAKLVEPPPDEQAVAAVFGLQLSRHQDQAIRGLRADLHDHLGEAARARTLLVDGVLGELAQGTLDRGRLDPVVRAFVAASEQAKPQVLVAINELHAILTPEQRAALVDGLAERGDEGEAEGKRRLKQMLKALDLGMGQQLELASQAKERLAGEKDNVERLKAQLRAAAEAFKGDSFDAAALELAQGPLVEHWLEVMLSLLEVVVPVLDEQQRLTFVAMARKMLGAPTKDN
jgi:Spy/CpxP family protein refolding chaperone